MPKTAVLPHEVIQLASDRGFSDRIDEVVAVAHEMFAGDVFIETDFDPEWPAEPYIVVQ